MWETILGFFREKKVGKEVNTESIRNRLKSLGWSLREIPIKKQKVIGSWKIIAFNGKKSYEVVGKTSDDAIRQLGVLLGVVAKNADIN